MRIAQEVAERGWIVVLERGGHIRPPGIGVGQSAGLFRMARRAFENEMREGREI
jgi:hypothetical protein